MSVFGELMVVVTMKMVNGISAVPHASMCVCVYRIRWNMCTLCVCVSVGEWVFHFKARKMLMFRQNDSVEIIRIKIWWAESEMSLVNVYIYIFNVCLRLSECVNVDQPLIHLWCTSYIVRCVAAHKRGIWFAIERVGCRFP